MPRPTPSRIFTPPVWGLLALMGATRFHHFGDLQTLPDASLAVFFLAGRFVASPWIFGLLLAAAGLIDWLAIAYGGVSGWCVTPAYLFLISTYGAMWLGGRVCRRFPLDDPGGLGRTFALLLASTLVAWAISSGSFYVLSGYFDDLTPGAYVVRILPYLALYLLTPLAYTALVLAGGWVWRQTGSFLLPRT